MFLQELKRRNVLQVLAAYLAGGWFLMKTGEVIFPTLDMPEWGFRALVLVLAAGLPLAGIFAWLFELTADGFRLQSQLDREGAESAPAGSALTIFSGLAVVLAGSISFYTYTSGQANEKPDLGALSAPPNSIAVLPFANISPDADNEYFADGLAEELTGMLSGIHQLNVTGRTSAFSFKHTDDDVTSIGRKLNVAHILEGSVRKAGPSVRVSVKLVKAADGYQLWSETYDRTLKDVFALQEEIADKVVDALKIKLLQDQLGINPISAGADPQAYDLYLQARFALQKRGPEDVKQAIDLLQRATSIDRNFSAAYATLGFAYGSQALRGYVPLQAGLKAAVLEARRALVLDPDLVQAHYVIGMAALYGDRDVSSARASFQQALDINPNDQDSLRGIAAVESLLGHFESALKHSERALERDPLAMSLNRNYAIRQWYAGKSEEAVDTLEKTLALYPDAAQTHTSLAFALVYTGELQRALEVTDGETSEPWRLYTLSIVLHALDREEEAKQALATLIEKYEEVMTFQIAEVYGYMGRRELAFLWLEKADELGDGGLMSLVASPFLRGLHNEPRFIALREKLGLPSLGP